MAKRVGATAQLATGEAITIDHDTIKVATIDPHRVQPIIDSLRGKGFVIKSMRSIRPSLEDLFMEAVTDPTTGKSLLPGAAREGSTWATKRRGQ